MKYAKASCGKEELKAIEEALEYGYFGLAHKVVEFEEQLKKYLSTDNNVITTNTGTSALHLALDAIGVKEGDEVILPSFTFVSSAQAVTACGAEPVFCDVNESTLLIDLNEVEKKITKRTKAIMPVHYAGNTCDMTAIEDLRQKYGIRIVEDAAHAFGSFYNGLKIGSFGDITCFSFDSIKVMTCGEGGAISTSDNEIAESCRKKRLLGIDRKTIHSKDWKERSWFYDVKTNGFRYHMSNINASIGLEQLKKVDRFIEHRRVLCKLYDCLLKDIPHIQLLKVDYNSIAPFMYVIKVKQGNRNQMQEFLRSKDIETAISYIPCHRFSFYEKEDLRLPKTDRIFDEILCLPLHFDVSEGDARFVASCIEEFTRGTVSHSNNG